MDGSLCNLQLLSSSSTHHSSSSLLALQRIDAPHLPALSTVCWQSAQAERARAENLTSLRGSLLLDVTTRGLETKRMATSLLLLCLLFLLKRYAQSIEYSVTTLAGGGSMGTDSGSINGVGTAALFFNPNGVSVDKNRRRR